MIVSSRSLHPPSLILLTSVQQRVPLLNPHQWNPLSVPSVSSEPCLNYYMQFVLEYQLTKCKIWKLGTERMGYRKGNFLQYLVQFGRWSTFQVIEYDCQEQARQCQCGLFLQCRERVGEKEFIKDEKKSQLGCTYIGRNEHGKPL